MKKIIVTMLCATLLLSTPIYAGAQGLNKAVGEGYTSDGVYYTGILKLYAFTYENGNTIAVYKGSLTAVN